MTQLFKIFNTVPEVQTFFSERSEGDMRLKTEGLRDFSAEFWQNRQKYFQKIGIPAQRVVSPLLDHGNNVTVVSSAQAGQVLEHLDAMVCGEAGIYLSVTVADCLPIFFYDPKHRAIGLAHAGWRGLLSGVIQNTITKLQFEFQTEPKDLLVGIGPGIGDCHYEIQSDLEEKFLKYPEAIKVHADGKTYLDLKLIAREQLMAAGVLFQNVETYPECTVDFPKKYFSFRRDKPKTTQAMIALIGLKLI